MTALANGATSIGRVIDHDGYGVHVNPDGSVVFTEGHKQKAHFFDKGEYYAIDKCYRKRGLHQIWSTPKALFKLGRLKKVCNLERDLCEEERWG